MTHKEFISVEAKSRDVIDVKRVYVDIAGDLTSGVLFSQIMYWHLPDNKGNPTRLRVKKKGHLWLAKQRQDWWEECRITPRQFDYSLSKLEKRELVISDVFKFDGNPTKHVRINWDKFLEVYNQIINEGVDSIKFEGGKWKLTNCEERNSQNVNLENDKLCNSLTKNTTEITTETNTTIPKQQNSVSDVADNSLPESSETSLSGVSGKEEDNIDNEKLTYVQTVVDYFNGLKGRYPNKITAKINRPAKTTTVDRYSKGRYRTILKWFNNDIPSDYVCDWLQERIPKLKTSIGGSLNYFENVELDYISPERRKELDEYRKQLLGEEE